MTKAALKEKEKQIPVLAALFSVGAKAQSAWHTDHELKSLVSDFVNKKLPKDATNVVCMHNFLEFVRMHPSDIEAWKGYLRHPPFLKNLLPLMAKLSDQNQRFQLQFERYPQLSASAPPTAAPAAPADSKPPNPPNLPNKKRKIDTGETKTAGKKAIPAPPPTDEKLNRIKEENQKLDLAIWGGILTAHELEVNKMMCPTCKQTGTLNENFKQTRSGDEGSTLFLTCRYCDKKERN